MGLPNETKSPRRRVLLFAAILLVGLAVVWPVADEYLGVCRQSEELQASLTDTQASDPDGLKTEVEAVRQQLDVLREMAFSREDVGPLRDWLIDSARRADCRVRQVTIGDEQRRIWRQQDTPFAEVSSDDDIPETPFELVSRDITLAVSGGVSDVRAFLDTMDRMDRLVHVQQLDIRRADEEHGNVNLQIALVLYDLEPRPEDEDGPDAPGPESDDELR